MHISAIICLQKKERSSIIQNTTRRTEFFFRIIIRTVFHNKEREKRGGYELWQTNLML